MTHNRFLNFHCVYTFIQVVHTEFIKIALTEYSSFKSASRMIQEQAAGAFLRKTSQGKKKRKKSQCETLA